MKLGSCDLIVKPRITGHCKERISISSDEGDGFMFHQYPEYGKVTDELKEGWKSRLSLMSHKIEKNRKI